MFQRIKGYRYLYLHPHGLGDLIISMPYIRKVMAEEKRFALCVKDEIYFSGFFKNYPFKGNVFPGCPPIWNRTQTIKNFKKIDALCLLLKDLKVEAFYLKFQKDKDRRLQVWEGLTCKLNYPIEFEPEIHGEVYLSQAEIDWVRENIGNEFCFLHSSSPSFIKSVLPARLKRYLDPEKEIFCPGMTSNININFAAQLLAKKNLIIDSVYLHSAGALKKDIDVLFVSWRVKKFISTLLPRNVKIHRIIYGNLLDVIFSFFYYEILSGMNSK